VAAPRLRRKPAPASTRYFQHRSWAVQPAAAVAQLEAAASVSTRPVSGCRRGPRRPWAAVVRRRFPVRS